MKIAIGVTIIAGILLLGGLASAQMGPGMGCAIGGGAQGTAGGGFSPPGMAMMGSMFGGGGKAGGGFSPPGMGGMFGGAATGKQSAPSKKK